MRARTSPRIIPASGRYFHVDLAAALDTAADERVAKRRVEAEALTAKTTADELDAATVKAADLLAKAEAWASSARARAAERRAEGSAMHAFRVPGAADVAGVWTAVQQVAAEDDIGDRVAHSYAKLGLQIGTCWFGAGRDLEATRAQGEDRIAYGARVYEELIDAGYLGIELIALAKACGAKIGDAFIAESEVADRAGFTVPTTGCWT